MVAAIRHGESVRSVAARFGVSPPTVQRWVDRAKGKRLDRTSFTDLPSAPRRVANRVSTEMEKLVLNLRQQLRDQSDLGEFGAAAILRELESGGIVNRPSLRTIGYILERNGALDYRHRIRHKPPPVGWYLPDVAARLADMDLFDFVEGLVIEGGIEVEVFNCISVHGGLVGSWPECPFTAERAREAILEHWRRFGLPDYAQFDNDTRFQGPHQYPDTLGTIIRMCLSLRVVPVFAPPREQGLQNAIESFNGRWQAKVWARFHHEAIEALQAQSGKYVAAYRARSAARMDAAPKRRAFPGRWKFNPQAKLSGRIIYSIY
jgi:transposase-like protein